MCFQMSPKQSVVGDLLQGMRHTVSGPATAKLQSPRVVGQRADVCAVVMMCLQRV